MVTLRVYMWKNLNENEDASKIRGQCYDKNIYNYCNEPNEDNVVCKISGKSTCNHNGQMETQDVIQLNVEKILLMV